MKPLLISSGEPSGIGPDICLALAGSDLPVVVTGDLHVLQCRAKQLGKPIYFEPYQFGKTPTNKLNHLTVLPIPCVNRVIAGKLDHQNASYVLNLLQESITRCLSGEFSALVTAPVHKAVINQAGFDFTGHTEFLARQCQIDQVVMMLASQEMKVALVTTHVPVCDISRIITKELLTSVIMKVYQGLQKDFGIANPVIYVAGLNPHAGESGYLGREEIDVMMPVLSALRQQGLNVQGPFPADTMFTPHHLNICDVFVAMYHDQGLPVIKYASFGQAVNVTLGLPIIRTSVDHGTALELAGTGLADAGSLFKAVEMAADIVSKRQ